MLNLMLDIKVSSLIQITDGINVSGFEWKVDLKIVCYTMHATSNMQMVKNIWKSYIYIYIYIYIYSYTQVKQTQTAGESVAF